MTKLLTSRRHLIAKAPILLCVPAISRSRAFAQGGIGPGPGTPNSACVPFSYTGTPVYQSLAFTDSWSPTAATFPTNVALSPACTTTAASLVENTATASHLAQKNVTVGITARNYTTTWFAKRGVGGSPRNFQLNLSNEAFNAGATLIVDLGSNTVNTQFAFGTGWSFVSASTTLQPNGYCKCVFTVGVAVDTGMIFQFILNNASFSQSYLGDGVSNVLFWGLDFR